MVVFKTKILLSRLKIRGKRHKLKEKVQKSALIPFCGQTRAFRYEIVFRGIQPYLFYTFQSYPVLSFVWPQTVRLQSFHLFFV